MSLHTIHDPRWLRVAFLFMKLTMYLYMLLTTIRAHPYLTSCLCNSIQVGSIFYLPRLPSIANNANGCCIWVNHLTFQVFAMQSPILALPMPLIKLDHTRKDILNSGSSYFIAPLLIKLCLTLGV